jgi:DNA-binding CsgD family transcriptional regulator
MFNSSVIIATNALFLADILKDKLRDINFKVFIAGNDNDLTEKIKLLFPRCVFLEHCFHGYVTDTFIKRLVKYDSNLRVAVWTASEIKPNIAARFILAGAESFFSLRDTSGNIESILGRITAGKRYCPVEVENMINRECAVPIIGEALTEREKEIVLLTINGKTNEEIGKELSISVHCVKFHKANIYRKCGGKTPVEILSNGLRRGILTSDDFL